MILEKLLGLDVDGKGFTQKLLNTPAIKEKIDAFYYNSYNCKILQLMVVWKCLIIKGYFNSNDPNLKMDFDGTIDLSLKL